MRLPRTFSRWLTRLCLATLVLCAALYIVNIFWTITLYTHTKKYGLWSGRGVIGIAYQPDAGVQWPFWTTGVPGPGLSVEHNGHPVLLLPQFGRMRPWPACYAMVPVWMFMIPGTATLVAYFLIRHPRAGFWGWLLLLTLLGSVLALLLTTRSTKSWVWPGTSVRIGSGGLLVRWTDTETPSPPSRGPTQTGQMYIYPGPENIIALLAAMDDYKSNFIWSFSLAKEDGPNVLRLPLWMLLPVVGVPMVIVWPKAIQRAGPGRCINCGYDLSGLPAPSDHATPLRCPECGHDMPTTGTPTSTLASLPEAATNTPRS